MLIRTGCFNTYLLAGLLALLAAGCASPSKDSKKDGKKDNKHVESALRLHLEVNPHPASQTTQARIGRSDPIAMTVDAEPFLTEMQVDKASVINTLGGFSIVIQFNSDGTILLEQYTAANNGRRMAIGAEFGESRWIAAPVIRKRLAEGQLVFTPDLTREEAERLVRGLNRVAELVRKGRK